MAGWLGWMSLAGGLLAVLVAVIGYRIGLARGRRRERRARTLDDRLRTAVAGLPDQREVARQARARRPSARSKPPCLL